MIDKNKVCLQQVYKDSADWANENVAGKNFADRFETMRFYYETTKGRTTGELFWKEVLAHPNKYKEDARAFFKEIMED